VGSVKWGVESGECDARSGKCEVTRMERGV